MRQVLLKEGQTQINGVFMKRLVGFFLITSLSLYSTPIKAESYKTIVAQDVSSEEQCYVTPQLQTQEQNPTENTDSSLDRGNYSDQEESLVSSESPEHVKRAKSRRWHNILLAIVTIAVAVTGILLVHSNQGNKK